MDSYTAISQKQQELERAFMGCVVINQEFVSDKCHWLDPSLFANELYGKLWAGVLEGQDILDVATTHNATAEVFGLMNSTPQFARAPEYAKAIAKRSYYRFVLSSVQDVARAAQQEDRDAVEYHLRSILELDDGDDDPMRDPEDVAESLIERMERDDLSIPFGIKSVDWATGGQERGTMTIWAARTSMGKSALAMEFAEHQALELGLRVGFFALEMSAEQMMARRLCHKVDNLQGYPASWQDVRSKNIDRSQQLALNELVRGYAKRIKGKLFIQDQPYMTSRDIERIQKKMKFDVIYIDHGGLLKDRPLKGERHDQLIGRFTMNLHELAKTEYCVVNLLWQLRRGAQQRANKRPDLEELRDSGHLEQNADNVVLLYRESYYDPNAAQDIDPMELILAKYRDGARAFSCYVGFDLRAQKFTSLWAEDIEKVAEQRMEEAHERQADIPF